VKKRRRAKRRHLWVTDDGGRWRTRGEFAAATTLGTNWIMRDTCTSTTVSVLTGALLVRPVKGGKVVTVRAPRSFTVHARPRRS
jgi:hypothetical protein